ncbi:MAG: HdeD family acid-resistance protein [Protaetiibacter sp.]
MSTDNVLGVSSFVKSIWWLVLLRGIFAVILGILAFVWPVATAVAFVWVFAFYAIVDGIVNIVHAVSTRKTDATWGWLLTIGIVGVIAGIVVMIFPVAAGALALLVLLWIVAIWAIVSGIFGIPAAATIASGGARVLGIVFSVLEILFGVLLAILLFTTPQSALIGLIYVLGAYAVLAGIVLVVIAFQARAAANEALRAA